MIENSDHSVFNQMYLINHPTKITEVNPPELVLARARSRIDDTGYNLFDDNCEHFATYCKTGCAYSHQIEWLWKKFEECVAIPRLKSFIEVSVSEGIEFLVRRGVENGSKWVSGWLGQFFKNYPKVGPNTVGAFFVVLIETILSAYDFYVYFTKRGDGEISKREFIEALTRRTNEGIWTTVGAIVVGVGCSLSVTGPLLAIFSQGWRQGSPVGRWEDLLAHGVVLCLEKCWLFAM